MNWIEIDNILRNLYRAYCNHGLDEYISAAAKQFKWSKRQAEVATRLIIEQESKRVNEPSSGNDNKSTKKTKKKKEKPAPTASRTRTRKVAKKDGSGQDKAPAKSPRKTSRNKRSS